MLAHALPTYRPLLTALLLTGCRISELLGLTWHDVDFDAAVIRIRAQLSRKTRERKSLKTPAAERDVVMAPTLSRLLKAHRMASAHKDGRDFVFCTATGAPHTASNVTSRGLHHAVTEAKIPAPRPRLHDLRHTYASALIGEGADIVFVSGQLGHANPAITLAIYASEFARAAHEDRFRTLLDGTLGAAVTG